MNQDPAAGGDPGTPATVPTVRTHVSVLSLVRSLPAPQVQSAPVEDYTNTPGALWASCSNAIEHAERGGARLYLTLLPADLRVLVDRFIRRSAWLHSGMLVPTEKQSPPSISAGKKAQFVVLRNGERLWISSVFLLKWVRLQLPYRRRYTRKHTHTLLV